MSIIFNSLPVDGPLRITSKFGPRNTGIPGASTYHRGVDLGADRSRYKGGTDGGPVIAVMGGVVTANYYNSARGWVVLIDHGTIDGSNVKTLYQHLRAKGLPVGARVSAGDQVARMGNTGVGAQLHLHFELRQDGSPVNPEPFLKNIEKEAEDMTEAEVRKIVKEELAGAGKPASDWAVSFWAARTADGTVDGTNPQGVVTREQAATMLSKVIERGGK